MGANATAWRRAQRTRLRRRDCQAIQQPFAQLLPHDQLVAQRLDLGARYLALEVGQVVLQELAKHSRVFLREIEHHRSSHLQFMDWGKFAATPEAYSARSVVAGSTRLARRESRQCERRWYNCAPPIAARG